MLRKFGAQIWLMPTRTGTQLNLLDTPHSTDCSSQAAAGRTCCLHGASQRGVFLGAPPPPPPPPPEPLGAASAARPVQLDVQHRMRCEIRGLSLWKVQNPDSKTPAVPQVPRIGFQDSRI